MRVLCLTEIHLRRSNPSHFKEISQDNLREERWYVEIRNFYRKNWNDDNSYVDWSDNNNNNNNNNKNNKKGT